MPNAGDDDASLQGATGPVRESMQLTDSVVFSCAWQASGAEQESQTSQSPEPAPQEERWQKDRGCRCIDYRGYMYIDKDRHTSFSFFGPTHGRPSRLLMHSSSGMKKVPRDMILKDSLVSLQSQNQSITCHCSNNCPSKLGKESILQAPVLSRTFIKNSNPVPEWSETCTIAPLENDARPMQLELLVDDEVPNCRESTNQCSMVRARKN